MPIEQLFASFKSDRPSTAAYDPHDPESYESFIHAMISDSRDYEGSVLAPDRNEAQAYYYGLRPGLSDSAGVDGSALRVEEANVPYDQIVGDDADDANRSTFVSTDVRDAILLMLPGLIRLFGATENPVYLVPRSEAEIETAEQGTDYVNYVFWNDNDGFLNLYGAFKDAMTVKAGFLKWWTDDTTEKKRKTYLNITPDQIETLLGSDPTAQVLKQGKPSPDGTIDSVTFQYEVSKPLIKVAGVPPEEMRLDRYARNFRESRIVGHERLVPVDQMIAMGYDRDLCMNHIQSQSTPEFTMEAQFRNPGRFMSTRVGDGVMYGEWYIKIDKDGDGVPELRHICTMGETHEIVHDEEANRVKFCHFGVDPISHTIIGDSIADLTLDIQNIKTAVYRAILDSAAESTNPKTVVNELTTNVDDALNDDLGAVIRTRGDVNSAVAFNNIPFLGQQIMPVIEMLNDISQRRTGLSDAAKGLDPKALQSSTMIGVEAVINGAQERIELVARVIAETGFKDLFSGLYNEACEAPNQKRTIKIRGRFVPYDTSTFDASMSVEVNQNLGKGSDQVRMMALAGIKADQQQIIAQYGLSNPVCGIPELMNTMTDMLALSNIKNVGRYFKMPTDQQMQQILSQPKAPDPQAVVAQSMLEKVRAETAKAVGQQALDREKMEREDSFKHEQLHTQTAVDLEKIHSQTGDSPSEHALNLGKLGATLMKAHSDADAQDQSTQLDYANAQHDQDLASQQQQHEQALAQQELAQKHMASMTQIASQHHLQETAAGQQHGRESAKIVTGALAGDADRVSANRNADLDRRSSEKIAKFKPKAKT